MGWPAMRKTGPNDASCVVWAIGKSFFLFSLFFIHSNRFFFVYLGLIRVINRWRGLGWPAMRKTGPNDAKRVVWAIGKSFFFSLRFFFIFFIYLGLIHVINRQRGLGWPAIRKTGPNNASCVVWAISMCFFFSITFFMY